ncbi:hypothetical protein BE08_02940 [Sorangium cellulosum]|uniref:HNH nuclease domain-containing protein n=1 Tax=Sorangium cellulosum TaxID=56 RepID=A0A150P2E0_SORCE|nr:hypothetical protein BE08_02940 [Sorangium cellulosum]
MFLVLGAHKIATGDYVYAARMAAAAKEHRAARAAGRTMPIIFGDASEDSGRLYKWALLNKLEVTDASTELGFSAVRDLDQHFAPELRKLSDGRPLGRSVRKGYSVVYTPEFLQTRELGGDDDVDGSRREVLERAAAAADVNGEFDPKSVVDARERTLAAIVRRQGQPAFRADLLRAYGGKCALSGCGIIDVLEAAHIVPYQGPRTNDVKNGILLRADLHTLFDLGLIAIDTATMTIMVASELAGSEYERLAGRRVRRPSRADAAPSTDALDEHRARSRL